MCQAEHQEFLIPFRVAASINQGTTLRTSSELAVLHLPVCGLRPLSLHYRHFGRLSVNCAGSLLSLEPMPKFRRICQIPRASRSGRPDLRDSESARSVPWASNCTSRCACIPVTAAMLKKYALLPSQWVFPSLDSCPIHAEGGPSGFLAKETAADEVSSACDDMSYGQQYNGNSGHMENGHGIPYREYTGGPTHLYKIHLLRSYQKY